jgi:pimeloyl-ACP methyl ester carboxylesterase/DNA-binding CsgD family transcriptional regulator
VRYIDAMTIRYTTASPHIAYAVHGAGAETLIVVPGWVSHLAFDWETPETRAFHKRLAATRRVIRYDKRGTGLSDRPNAPDAYSLDTRVHDLAIVMDAVGVHRTDLFGWSEGGTIALAFAARYPERVARLVTFGSYARTLAAPDYPCGSDPERDAAISTLVRAEWGTGSRIMTDIFLPEVDEARASWFTMWQRMSLTPEAAVASSAANSTIDIRALLPTITTPTLVIQRCGDFLDHGRSTYVAAHLPNARLETLEGEHHVPFFGDAEAITDAINRFLVAPPTARPIATAPPGPALSPREMEVLRLVAEGMPNRAVADQLSLSEKTVNRHLMNIYTKLGVNTRGAAIAHAFRQGFMQP